MGRPLPRGPGGPQTSALMKERERRSTTKDESKRASKWTETRRSNLGSETERKQGAGWEGERKNRSWKREKGRVMGRKKKGKNEPKTHTRAGDSWGTSSWSQFESSILGNQRFDSRLSALPSWLTLYVLSLLLFLFYLLFVFLIFFSYFSVLARVLEKSVKLQPRNIHGEV